MQLLVFVVHFLNAFWHGKETFPKSSSQNEIVPLLIVFHLPYSKYKGVKMFLLVSLSKSKFFTRAALVSLVQHSCYICVTLVSLVSHSCCTRVASVTFVLHSCCSCRTRAARVWRTCCKLDQIGLRPGTLLKKRLGYRCFPVTFAKFLRAPFLQNISGRLLP